MRGYLFRRRLVSKDALHEGREFGAVDLPGAVRVHLLEHLRDLLAPRLLRARGRALHIEAERKGENEAVNEKEVEEVWGGCARWF